jgi:hypothetical protein
VREALVRDDIWGIGLSMSVDSVDTENGFWQFVYAYDADYVTRDGRLVIDDPEVRRRLIQVIDKLHGRLPQGLHPTRFGDVGRLRQQRAIPGAEHRDDAEPDALDPNALKATRPEDYYYKHAVTIDWPDGAPAALGYITPDVASEVYGDAPRRSRRLDRNYRD